MGITCRLKKGIQYLNLAATPYAIMNDFTPPTAGISAAYAPGTASNRYVGAPKIDEQSSNIDFSFSVRISGSTYQEVEYHKRSLAAFLRKAGDPQEPLYLEYRGESNFSYEPIWGQAGACKRLQVEHGVIVNTSLYTAGPNTRNAIQVVTITLACRPFILGSSQVIGWATGGIFEDTYGMVAGNSRGLCIPPADATGNAITDPVYRHSPTDWSTGSDLTLLDIVYYGEFVLPETQGYSTKLFRETGSTNISHTLSININDSGTWCLSCYIKKQDYSAVTVADVKLTFDSAATNVTGQTYQSIGNGWYRLYGVLTGPGNNAKPYGLELQAGSIYVTGWQLEKSAYPTPLMVGSMLGCAWAGTAHDSNSTRTAGMYKIEADLSNLKDAAEGTIYLAWKAGVGAAAMANGTFFDGVLDATFTTADNKINFLNGTDTVSTAAQTFAQDDILRLAFTWKYGGGTMKIYQNGVEAATGDVTAVASGPGDIYIGSSSASAAQVGGTFLGFEYFEHAMSAAEVLAFDTDAAQAIAEGGRYDWLPWVWTKDGDNTLDNENDATHDNFAMVGGIPGDVPAETTLLLTTSEAKLYTNLSVWLSLLPVEYWQYNAPTNFVYQELTGGDETVSVGTSETGFSLYQATDTFRVLDGKEWYLWAKLTDAGTTLSLRARSYFGQGYYYAGNWTSCATADGTNRFFICRPLSYPAEKHDIYDPVTDIAQSTTRFGFLLRAKRATGSGNVVCDYMQLLFRPLCKITSTYDGTDGRVRIRGRTAVALNDSSQLISYSTVTGDVIEFTPGKMSYFWIVQGDSGVAYDETDTMVITQASVIPRWLYL